MRGRSDFVGAKLTITGRRSLRTRGPPGLARRPRICLFATRPTRLWIFGSSANLLVFLLSACSHPDDGSFFAPYSPRSGKNKLRIMEIIQTRETAKLSYTGDREDYDTKYPSTSRSSWLISPSSTGPIPLSVSCSALLKIRKPDHRGHQTRPSGECSRIAYDVWNGGRR